MAVGKRSPSWWRRTALLAVAAVLVLSACTNSKKADVLGRQFTRPTTTTPAPVPAVVADSPAVDPSIAPTGPTSTVASRGRAPAARGPGIQTSVGGATGGPTYNPMVFTVRVTGNLGRVQAVTLDFGDGSTAIQPLPDPSATEPACTPADGSGDSSFATEFSHGFRRPGNYPVRITLVDLACNPDPVPQGPAFTARITPGPDRSNGPATPTARNCLLNAVGFCASADGRQGSAFAGGLADSDGYVIAARVDWGDGSAPSQTSYPLSECQDPGTRWPSSARDAVSWQHTYAGPGDYTVTLTVLSAGCDGRDVQESPFTQRLTVT